MEAGKDIGLETPCRNVFVVGDGAKGDAIEVDGIALGVEKVIESISHHSF